MRPKWRQASLWAGKRTGGNLGSNTEHQGSETTVQFLSSIALADAAPLQNGAISFPDGTTRGFEAGLTQPSQQSVASILIHHARLYASAQT